MMNTKYAIPDAEFARGFDYVENAVEGLAPAEKLKWGRSQRYRLSLALGGMWNRGVAHGLAAHGL